MLEKKTFAAELVNDGRTVGGSTHKLEFLVRARLQWFVLIAEAERL